MTKLSRHTSTTSRGSRGRRRVLVTIAAAAMLLGVQVPTTAAAASLEAVCSAKIPLNLNPGLKLLVRTQGSNQSYGETGVLSCVGKLDGYTVAGPGTVGFVATYDGTCNSATGGGSWFFSVPVNDNGGIRVIHHTGYYQGPSVSLVISFNGTFETGRLAGTGPVVPVQGNCLTQPMTKATFNLVGLQLTQ